MCIKEILEHPDLQPEPGDRTYYVGNRTLRGDILVNVCQREDANGDSDRPMFASCEPLDPRNDVRNHSPDGFNWGYGGSGPSQLALAILCHATNPQLATKHYHRFKWDFIAPMNQNHWFMSMTYIRGWVAGSEMRGT